MPAPTANGTKTSTTIASAAGAEIGVGGRLRARRRAARRAARRDAEQPARDEPDGAESRRRRARAAPAAAAGAAPRGSARLRLDAAPACGSAAPRSTRRSAALRRLPHRAHLRRVRHRHRRRRAARGTPPGSDRRRSSDRPTPRARPPSAGRRWRGRAPPRSPASQRAKASAASGCVRARGQQQRLDGRPAAPPACRSRSPIGSGATPKGTPGAISPTNHGPLMVMRRAAVVEQLRGDDAGRLRRAGARRRRASRTNASERDRAVASRAPGRPCVVEDPPAEAVQPGGVIERRCPPRRRARSARRLVALACRQRHQLVGGRRRLRDQIVAIEERQALEGERQPAQLAVRRAAARRVPSRNCASVAGGDASSGAIRPARAHSPMASCATMNRSGPLPRGIAASSLDGEAVVGQRHRLDRARPACARLHSCDALLERLLLVGAVGVPQHHAASPAAATARSRQRPRLRCGQLEARAVGVEAVQPRRVERHLHALARRAAPPAPRRARPARASRRAGAPAPPQPRCSTTSTCGADAARRRGADPRRARRLTRPPPAAAPVSAAACAAPASTHVHLRRADEARDEQVGRPRVELARRPDLHAARRRSAPRCDRRASSPRPDRASRRSSSPTAADAAASARRASARAARRRGSTAARRTGRPWAAAPPRAPSPRAAAGRPRAAPAGGRAARSRPSIAAASATRASISALGVLRILRPKARFSRTVRCG